MKKILVLLTMTLVLLFGCDQITDDVSINNTNQENNNGENNNTGNQNQGNNEDNKDNQNGENEKTDVFTIKLIGFYGEEVCKLEVKPGEEISLPENVANILCWNTKANGSGESYNGTAVFNQSMTLYAILLPENSFKIIYELNGGINNPANLYYFTEEYARIYLKNPTKDGYTFGGWYETADFSGEKLEDVLRFEDLTFYAKWYDETTTIEVTSSDVVSKISELSDGVYIVKVTGVIDSAAIENIKTAMKNNQNALIDLDLSKTTGLTEIPEYAFAECNSLASLIIPEGVTSIGEYAFPNCNSLIKIVIPNSVTSIGENALACINLTKIVVNENNENYSISDDGKILYNKDKTELIFCCPDVTGDITIPDDVTTIGTAAFAFSNLTSLIIPGSVTTIGTAAFSYSNLTSLIIPGSVTTIPMNMSSFCYNLTNVTIGNGVKEILIGAFMNCPKLTSVVLPDSVTSIEKVAFKACDNLTKFVVSENNENYSTSDDGKILFNKDKTKLIAYPSAKGNIRIPDSVTSIDASFFYGQNLTGVTIGKNVTIIDDHAFIWCNNLETVVLSDSVTHIGNGTFDGCDNLTSITIGKGVTTIEKDAFYSCDNLETVNYRGTQEQWEQISIDSGNENLTNATINYNYTGN